MSASLSVAAKLRHRALVFDAADDGALQAVQHGTDVLGRIGVVDRRIALEGGERAGQTLAGGLVAGRAIGGEQLLTLGALLPPAACGAVARRTLPFAVCSRGRLPRLPERPEDRP